MCYNLKDRQLEEEARRLREGETRKRWQEADEARRNEREEEKPLTEKVREVVGSVR